MPIKFFMMFYKSLLNFKTDEFVFVFKLMDALPLRASDNRCKPQCTEFL